ncbi:hypothetical protein BOSE62_70097 [Bosea sp. 62]|nr:hypothetical protein BOSE21B_100082 [Bosea sp. 21B]CAD5286535.1 hypothetical protein BOSE7B_41446 [Bosea sp. 7B]CAD5301312.1 hypothetical protein BOSE46_90461 [Bosea sp. 46]VVT57410.1 hypothetical protein BOS5A_200082 [Bosea sp. EC-HK365B]VXB68037.1 hypothetical protein BOSE125_140173 [Bosea sp. 125]VXC68723.1 hypothetical protein BOSE62_70097 [Bosea sp. 62]VXC94671.1 hypothetical protein BOSE127_80231 [Bosea sp. 127]VXC96014.1 hypothetical protein BOSE29B_90078 [Bosea sp. 29B]
MITSKRVSRPSGVGVFLTGGPRRPVRRTRLSRSFARVPEPFGGEDEKQRPGTSRRTATITNARPPINHDHATVPVEDPLYPLVLQRGHALTGELKRALTEQGCLRASRAALPANLVRPGPPLSRLTAPRTRTNLTVIPGQAEA